MPLFGVGLVDTLRISGCIEWTFAILGAACFALNTVGSADAGPSPVSPRAQAAGLVDVQSVVPVAVIQLCYAATNNIVGQQLYPADARCMIHQDLARGLATAAAALRRSGEVLVLWDCCRSHDVQVRMFEAVPNPNWVVRPSDYARSHESGRSVDVTLADARYGWLVDMGTDFDDFTARSLAYAGVGETAAQQANRARLRCAMEANGLTAYSGEWWHFDGSGAKDPRPVLDVPIG